MVFGLRLFGFAASVECWVVVFCLYLGCFVLPSVMLLLLYCWFVELFGVSGILVCGFLFDYYCIWVCWLFVFVICSWVGWLGCLVGGLVACCLGCCDFLGCFGLLLDCVGASG